MLLGLDSQIELVEANTSDPDDSLRGQNPLGKIPALVTEKGAVIYDSAVIVEYLDALAGGGKIIPVDPDARFRSLTQAALADGICDAAVMMRYEAMWREPEFRSQKWLAHQGEKVDRALAAFEADPPQEISDVATISLACALGYLDLRFGGEWRAKFPGLVGWLDTFAEAVPAFAATQAG